MFRRRRRLFCIVTQVQVQGVEPITDHRGSCRCICNMFLTCPVALATGAVIVYQQYQLHRLHTQLEALDVQVQAVSDHTNLFDAFLRELWNSRFSLRPMLHPNQEWQWEESSTPF